MMAKSTLARLAASKTSARTGFPSKMPGATFSSKARLLLISMVSSPERAGRTVQWDPLKPVKGSRSTVPTAIRTSAPAKWPLISTFVLFEVVPTSMRFIELRVCSTTLMPFRASSPLSVSNRSGSLCSRHPFPITTTTFSIEAPARLSCSPMDETVAAAR